MKYIVRYLNTCQNDPIESRHRSRETAEKAARRLCRRIRGDGYSHDYRAEEIDDDGETIAIYATHLDEWYSVED